MNTTKTKFPEHLFTERINDVPKSFLREILKLTSKPNIISFAGGLPDPHCFPIESLQKCANEIFQSHGISSLQYSLTEGLLPLREIICEMYHNKYNMDINPSQILITNGSQQGLDLLGKVFINKDDKILLENPSYLGAIQSFSMYQPDFYKVKMESDGPDLNELENTLRNNKIKIMYAIPDFQNPTGYRWSEEKRKVISEILLENGVILIEDNPYGEINFSEKQFIPAKTYMDSMGIMLGTFSKTIAPGLRLGWIVAEEEIIQKLTIAKQASDLHTNVFSQELIISFLKSEYYEQHLQNIKNRYHHKRNIMINAIKKYFPDEVTFHEPEGGMFVWATLPEYFDAYHLLELCMEKSVAFVPGKTFYFDNEGHNTMRLNYSNSTDEQIVDGIKIIGEEIREMIMNKT